MERIVSPKVSELEKLKQPLTKGEKLVFDFFDQNLDLKWEIYIQPHMNGLRPDFVLLNSDVGIAVFEVKDWDLDAMSYRIEIGPDRVPKLVGEKDGKSFLLQKQNPIFKVQQYKEELFNLYCPRLQQGNGFAVITAGVIFPYADDFKVSSLFASSKEYLGMSRFPAYSPIVGREALASGDVSRVFPEGTRKQSRYMTEELARDLRYWLVEPDFSVTQRQPLELDSAQKSLVTGRTASGYRRIKGPAGSGKSLILAARAAQLISEGKSVLIITYNITLLHYLLDIAVRWPTSAGNTRKAITALNFHLWCKRVCEEAGLSHEYKNLWKGQNTSVLNDALPALVDRIIEFDTERDVTRYDAILVDEGQDFRLNWWNVLRKTVRSDGERLLVADATQDIYETASAWTDEAMKNAGFSGQWNQLRVSYRLPGELLAYAKQFAEKYLPGDSRILPEPIQQQSLETEPCFLRWVHVIPEYAATVCESEILRIFQQSEPQNLAISDITFLCDKKRIGLDVVRLLEQKKIRTVHTYSSDDKESRRQKVGFYMGDARVKATTLHSFKGWESRSLVIYISESANSKDLALLYIGLTRLKRSVDGSYLTVVSSAEKLMDFGKTFPDFKCVHDFSEISGK